MKKITLKQMIENSNIPAKLIRAVVSQSGGFDDFKEKADDISKYGAAGGFSCWTYYADTVEFTKRHKKEILEYAESQANDFGTPLLEMILSFDCIKDNEISQSKLAKILYSGRGDEDAKTLIYNCMAWYALEEVARLYVDLLEQ